MPDATPGIDAAPAAPETACHFTSAQHAEELLRRQGYIADGRIAGVVHLAGRLAKPVLVEGPAGTGKTQLAKSVAQACGLRLILVRSLRSLDLKKKPSISETLDWVRTLVLLNASDVDARLLIETMPVLLKNDADIEIALKEFGDSLA
jgi:MoxR-like ATPase